MSDLATLTKKLDAIQQSSGKRVQELESANKQLTEQNTKLKAYLKQPARDPAKIFATAKDNEAEGTFGWKSFGEFLTAVRDTANSQGRICDDRLGMGHYEKCVKSFSPIAKSTGLNELIGSEGGFLLAPTFVNQILEIMHEQAELNLLDRTENFPITGPSIKVPAVDETSRATGSRRGGIRGYWVEEGGTLTASQPQFKRLELTPHKLAVLTYLTQELIEDGGQMLEQYVSRYAAEEINYLVSNAIINGTGAGQPLGILSSGALISVTAEVGQAAATIVTENVVKMYARLHAASRRNAVWLINQDVTPQLYTLTLGVGTGGQVVYMPPGGLSGKPYATLYGLPVLETEWNATLGTVGDILLVDLKQYLSVKRDPIRADMSMHVQFLTDELAYRFIFRVDGQPWWQTALTPLNGTNTQSPYVALATRS